MFDFPGPAGLTIGQSVTGLNNAVYQWDGTKWHSTTSTPGGGGGIPEAPTDGRTYGRDGQTASWNPVLLTGSALAGDVIGTIGANTVVKLQGSAVSATAPSATNQVLQWSGSAWTPTALAGGGNVSTSGAITTGSLPSWASGTTIQSSDLSGDVSTAGSLVATVTKLQNQPVAAGVPTNGYVLTYNAGQWAAAAQTGGGNTTASGAAAGNLTAFTGPTTISVGNLSGDVTTSGTLATTVLSVAHVTTGTLPIANGGTGPTLTLPVLNGGTGATSAGAALTSLGAYAASNPSGYQTAAQVATTFAAPPAIGATTPAAGSFTTLSASSTVSGAGFSTYLASPPAIGSTTPAAGSFTTLGSSGLATLSNGLTVSSGTVSLPAASIQYAALPSEVAQVPMAFPFSGKPAASQLVNVPMPWAMTIPANFAGTVVYDTTLTTANAVFTVNRVSSANATTAIGTITITSGSHVSATLSTQAAFSLVIGDTLQIVAPATQDNTLADVGITIQCTRV